MPLFGTFERREKGIQPTFAVAKHLLGMAFCLVLTLCCTACSDDEIIAEVEIPKESDLQSVMECSGQTIEISIKSDSEWEVLYDFNAEEIAYAYPEKGSGDAKINLYVMEQPQRLCAEAGSVAHLLQRYASLGFGWCRD